MSLAVQDEYALALDSLVPALTKSYEKMKGRYASDASFDYSQAITNRLRAFYCAQLGMKGFLDKKIAQSGSDFFVETILFFLKFFNDVEDIGFEIRSEQAIQRRRNSLRPDITIWIGSELIAVIECKTQLGWHRRDWNSHFKEREDKIKELFPNSKIFLVVMSGSNWNGFGDDERVGKQLFCLLKNGIWPTNLPFDYDETVLENRIENLFSQLLNLRSNISCVNSP
jgi:hypothetical protein